MHNKEMTVFAQSSLSRAKEEMRLNLIMESQKTVPMATMKAEIFQKGAKRPFAVSTESVDALSINPRVLSKTFPVSSKIKGPIQVRLSLDQKQFLFEFQ